MTRELGPQDRAEAERLLHDPSPALPTEPPRMQFHRAKDHRR